jgi:hypothetical protein
MAGTLKLTAIEASSGSTITVAPATTLSLSADKLSVGGVLLSQGNTSVNVLTAASTDLADATHTAMWTGKNKAIFSVDASGSAKTVQLPAANAAGRSTVSIVISVKATSAVPATVSPNLVTVNNSSGAEVFTLYAVGDYVEFVSDGTNDLRTGNEHVSSKGFIFLNTNEAVSGNATEIMFIAGGSNSTIRYDWGGWWNNTNMAVEIPYACRVLVECFIWTQNHASQYLSPSLRRYYSSRASNEWIFRPDNKTASPTSCQLATLIHDFAAGEEIEYNAFNEHATVAATMAGGANGWYQGSYAKWTVVRRY